MRMDKNFESWAHRNNLAQLVRRLERESFLERLPGNDRDRIYRITDAGWQGLWRTDPEARWRHSWDGQWRIVLFDLPCEKNYARAKLLKALRSHGFGCLQGSAWISPFSLDPLRSSLSRGERFAASLLCLEGKPAGYETDKDLVLGAWDWDEIRNRWQLLHQALKERRAHESNTESWLQKTLKTWHRISDIDPFLPRALRPSRYPGPRVWKELMRAFNFPPTTS
jgi:phenylacetic acid degradation operon negative regulatory protein